MPKIYSNVILIVAVYFLIGAISIFLINKGKDQANRNERWIKYVMYLLIVAGMIVATWFEMIFILLGIAIVVIGYTELISVWRKFEERKILALMISLMVYTVIALGFLIFVIFWGYVPHLLVYTVVLTFDGFCQISGQLFGKHKLIPKVSPGKTWEGLAGGLIAAFITMVILDQDMLSAGLFALMISFSALVGDLLASYYKRLHRTKDYDSVIPGHGGFLDRFDSFLGAGCMFTIYTMVG